MTKTTVLVLYGGRSSEYEVSLVSASSILANIDRTKYDVITVGITKDGDWYHYTGEIEHIKNGSWCKAPSALEQAVLSPSPSDHALIIFGSDGCVKKQHIDVIFPVMHGANAEDGTLQGLLKLSGIPFVGCGCAASAIGMDKGFTKLVLKNFGIPQAKSIIVQADRFADNETAILDRCEQISSYPLFVKPANAGSSVGASKASDRASLRAAILAAAAHDSKIIVEEYIKGKEIECAVIGNGPYTASTCGEIITGSEFYDYDTKYADDSPATCAIPAGIQPDTAETVRTLAVRICAILGVSGLSRVDFFVRKIGGKEDVVFNEINTLPGFTQISMYPKLLMHDGMTYPEIIDKLIALAMEEKH